MRKILGSAAVVAILAAMSSAGAGAVELSIGSGDGSLRVDTDLFGTSRFAEYNPVGPIGSADTFFDSYIAINNVGGYLPFDEFGVDATIIEQTATSLISSFSINALDFRLQQSVAQTSSNGAITGAVFSQVLGITNRLDPGDDQAAVSFQLRRYLDGDLDFDGTLIDGGGVLRQGAGRPVLFEIDSVESGDGDGALEVMESDDVGTTFVGITAGGGMVPANGAFEVSECCDSDIRSSISLDDDVENDFDGDGFIDEPYDVKLALQNDFLIQDGASQTYTTTTIFGNADFGSPDPSPVQPGDIEALPLMPDMPEPGAPTAPGFRFTLPPGAIVERETIFIDPDIAVGYTYTVEGGSNFFSVTAPTFGAVPDPDGYFLTVGGTTVAIASGEEILFSTFGLGSIYEFELSGIDVDLMLSPTDGFAFVTGISLENVPASVEQIVTQTPITVFVDDGTMAPIPLPMSGWLLLSGVAGLVGFSRRRAN